MNKERNNDTRAAEAALFLYPKIPRHLRLKDKLKGYLLNSYNNILVIYI